MKNYIILSIFILMFSIPCFSQVGEKRGDTLINYIDINNKKQGTWEKYYKNGKLRYKGYFVNDIPTGVFNYFYDNGKSKSILNYDANARANAVLFWESGEKMAEGVYDVEKQRDGQWKMYSEKGKLACVIDYKNGKANGNVLMYFIDSDLIALNCYYKEGKLNGEYKLFFFNGFLQEDGSYEMGMRVGNWKYYGIDGKIIDEGGMQKGSKHGKWISYEKNPKGDTINYIYGFPENYNEQMKYLEDTLEWAKKNQDKFKRPEDYFDKPYEFFK